MPAKSKAQQKFMGMVYAAKKGGKPASKEVAEAAKSMTKREAKDFAETKHKNLPEKKEKEARESVLNSDAFLLGYLEKSADDIVGTGLKGFAGTLGVSTLAGALLGAVLARRKRRMSGAAHGALIGAGAGLGGLTGGGVGTGIGSELGRMAGGAAVPVRAVPEYPGILIADPKKREDYSRLGGALGAAGGGAAGIGLGAVGGGLLAKQLSNLIRARNKDPWEKLSPEEREEQRKREEQKEEKE